jgi:hypothetical protein
MAGVPMGRGAGQSLLQKAEILRFPGNCLEGLWRYNLELRA